MLSKERTAEIVKKYGKNEKDTGSAQVQIALLTAQINDLTAHLKANKKDASGRRGLFVLVGQRRALLNYLNKTDRDAYVDQLKRIIHVYLKHPFCLLWGVLLNRWFGL